MDDVLTRSELIRQGWTDRMIRAALDQGRLTRLRPGRYSSASSDSRMREAVALGGRLACVSELRFLSIWVLDDDRLHIQVPPTAARISADRARVHWRRLVVPNSATTAHVGVIDALVQSQTCLDPFAWIASVDSALHLGSITWRDVDVIRATVSAESRRLLAHVDRRAESGLESIVRMIAHEVGLRVRPQVRFAGIGRVDLVIEDWIVVETDGAAYHDTAVSARDRRRDALLAARGRVVLRPGYSLVVHRRAEVARQMIESVAGHRRVQHAGRIAARARRRLASADPSCIFDGSRLGG
jgi:very-short-patch-repair endonuclease